MMSSDERPIRIDCNWVGEERTMESSIDGVSVENAIEVLKGLDAPVVHLFGVLLHFTTKEGAMIAHSAFGEEAA